MHVCIELAGNVGVTISDTDGVYGEAPMQISRASFWPRDLYRSMQFLPTQGFQVSSCEILIENSAAISLHV